MKTVQDYMNDPRITGGNVHGIFSKVGKPSFSVYKFIPICYSRRETLRNLVRNGRPDTVYAMPGILLAINNRERRIWL
jgi:hypothetical protein